MKQISAIIITKVFALLLIAYLAQFFIPYLGFFPYADTLDLRLPMFIKSFANFDGVQYLLIAKQGYATYQQAYFPLYPLLIKIVGNILNISYFYSSLLISNIGFLIGLYYFYKLLRIDFDKRKTILGILFLILFPTSFYFHVIYTEGLFFALFVSFLYFLRKYNLNKALIISVFLSATRLIGAFSVIFLIPIVLGKARNIIARNEVTKQSRRNLTSEGDSSGSTSLTIRMTNMSEVLKFWSFGVLLLVPFLGLAIYMFYLWQTTGDPLFFFNSQPAFGANRSTHLIFLPQVYYRYFKMLFTAAFNWQYIVVLLELISFTLVAGILSFQSYVIARNVVTKQSREKQDQSNFLLSLNLFSWANILLPTLTGTFSSVPRYALFSVSIFYFLANIKNKHTQYFLLTLFAVLQIILFAFFIQGYFVA